MHKINIKITREKSHPSKTFRILVVNFFTKFKLSLKTYTIVTQPHPNPNVIKLSFKA